MLIICQLETKSLKNYNNKREKKKELKKEKINQKISLKCQYSIKIK